MRMLPAAGERRRGARPVAAYADAQRRREIGGEDLRRPGMIDRAPGAGALQVALMDNLPGLRVRCPVQPDHGAVYLVQVVRTEPAVQRLAADCLHAFQEAAGSAGLRAVQGNRGDQPSAHPPSIAAGHRLGGAQDAGTAVPGGDRLYAIPGVEASLLYVAFRPYCTCQNGHLTISADLDRRRWLRWLARR